jgi:hypothetical protein
MTEWAIRLLLWMRHRHLLFFLLATTVVAMLTFGWGL